MTKLPTGYLPTVYRPQDNLLLSAVFTNGQLWTMSTHGAELV